MIAEIFEQIKARMKEKQNDVALAVGAFLIAVISFGLGILTPINTNKAPIVIENQKYCATLGQAVSSGGENEELPKENSPGTFVASKNGKYYHLPDCPGAKNISAKNKIWFETKEEAESRGFKPASNCPKLQDY